MRTLCTIKSQWQKNPATNKAYCNVVGGRWSVPGLTIVIWSVVGGLTTVIWSVVGCCSGQWSVFLTAIGRWSMVFQIGGRWFLCSVVGYFLGKGSVIFYQEGGLLKIGGDKVLCLRSKGGSKDFFKLKRGDHLYFLKK